MLILTKWATFFPLVFSITSFLTTCVTFVLDYLLKNRIFATAATQISGANMGCAVTVKEVNIEILQLLVIDGCIGYSCTIDM